MSRFAKYLITGLVTLSLGVLIFLVTWDIRPETRQVETRIPDETLPR